MLASCPQCAMSLNFDDERLPIEPFNVLCPRCRQSVTIMPPSKEEPRLAGSTGSLDSFVEVAPELLNFLGVVGDALLVPAVGNRLEQRE